MFTGIIQATGEILSLENRGDALSMRLRSPGFFAHCHEGDSKPTASNIRRIPKKGEPGYDEFMRELFRSAGSNMLRDDEI